MTEPIDRFLRALLRDADPEDTLLALQETIVGIINTVPPSERHDFVRKLRRRLLPDIVRRANQLANERKGEFIYCRHHTTRH
jgi:hypothetical protein